MATRQTGTDPPEPGADDNGADDNGVPDERLGEVPDVPGQGVQVRAAGPPQPSESNSASTATASLADALASRGCLRALSLSASRCGLPSSSADISRSSSSSASSADLASRYRAVASSVASAGRGQAHAGARLRGLPARGGARAEAGAGAAGSPGRLLFYSCVPAAEFGSWPEGVPVQIHGMDADSIFTAEGDLDAARALAESVKQAELFSTPDISTTLPTLAFRRTTKTPRLCRPSGCSASSTPGKPLLSDEAGYGGRGGNRDRSAS
jgi:hypothetical protein